MDLKHLNDETLLKDLKTFVKQERALLTQVLHHLLELDSRKLYSSLGYSSLYEYACKELKYSADQAYRRIQAMRLLREIPELNQKIDSGALSLSNISQAQRYFNEAKANNNGLKPQAKLMVLKALENKSVREAQVQILELSPHKPLPPETKKQITPTHTQVNFLMSKDLEAKLEEVRSLLGPNAFCSMSELIQRMADLSVEKLKEKKFGKKRVSKEIQKIEFPGPLSENSFAPITLQPQQRAEANCDVTDEHPSRLVSKNLDVKKVTGRYISAQTKHKIWQNSCGQCVKCRSQRNLNIDHRFPLALGGDGAIENLRLLCFSCNQRQRLEARL